MEVPFTKFRRLEAAKIMETVKALHDRVEERFPGSGLGKVIAELQQVAEETVERTGWIQQPHLLLRCVAGTLSLGILVLLGFLIAHVRQFNFEDFTNSVQALDSSIGSVVFVGAAILFFLNWEHRIKRDRALKAIHELRALAHIVDMHQLTKDPDRVASVTTNTASSPVRSLTPMELGRYLDYCSELLSLISKIAALHVQHFNEQVVLGAVNDIETLATGLSSKIWQKISLLNAAGARPG